MESPSRRTPALAFAIGLAIGLLVVVADMLMLGDVLRHHLPRLRDPRLSYAALVPTGVGAIAVVIATSGHRSGFWPMEALAPPPGGVVTTAWGR